MTTSLVLTNHGMVSQWMILGENFLKSHCPMAQIDKPQFMKKRIFLIGGRNMENSVNHRNYFYQSSIDEWAEIGITFDYTGRQNAACFSAEGQSSHLILLSFLRVELSPRKTQTSLVSNNNLLNLLPTGTLFFP